jgi:DNA-binding IclR family transcriptional regulator
MNNAQAVAMVPRSAGTDASVVKSAGRALQILEYFDSVQREACVSEISRALKCPQSSTSVLLKSLVSLGYLQNDRYRRTYFPTRRVCLLGNWVDPALVRQGELLMQAEGLAKETQQTVIIATVNGLQVQHIYLNRSQKDPVTPVPSRIGMHCSLGRTALGKALLAGHSDKYISQLIWRVNAERSDQEPLIDIPTLLSELQQGRKRGWFTGDGSDSSRSGIATTLDRKQQLLSIGLEQVGPISEADEIAYSKLLRNIATMPVSYV